MTDLIGAFWDGRPLVDFVTCHRCGEPVATDEAVALIDADQWTGWAHDVCPESGDIGGGS